MAKKKRGLKRPKEPVDMYTLQPEPELVTTKTKPSRKKAVKRKAKPKKKTKKKAAKKKSRSKAKSRTKQKAVPRDDRIKTSVEFLPETLELIEKIQAQYRRKHKRRRPMWLILDDAVHVLAKSKPEK